MSYSELIQAYFERSTALQWYWTVYVLVIGGLLAFSVFRQRPETVTVVLVTALYVCFAYKNLGAIEVTLMERGVFREAIEHYGEHISTTDPKVAVINNVEKRLKPILPLAEPEGVRPFHIACDLMTIIAVWAKEWHRRKTMNSSTVPQAS